MYGAILGDMVGAPYEFDRGEKTKEFEFWNRKVHFTDDSVMSIAVADALMRAGRQGTEQEVKEEVVKAMQDWGRRYPYAGYGGNFAVWIWESNPKPYGSWGNGSAMRVSAVGWLYDNLERTREVARWTAEVTHNHPEGVKGAEATASAIYLARNGVSKEEIKTYIRENFGYDLTRTCDEIRPAYHHVESCQETVPEAITAFLEGKDFEDVIRTAVSLGGDSDTLTCIAGGIAEAFYGIPLVMEAEVKNRLSDDMLRILERFDEFRGRSAGKDDDLKWNNVIEEAISAFHQETNNEKFSAVIEAIYHRMYENGCFMIPVIAPQNAFDMIDLEHMKVGDVVTTDEDLHFKFQHLNTEDGKLWAVAFTSEAEYQKGDPSDMMRMAIRQLLEGFSGDCQEEGIIINPWGDKLLLTKEWINEILQNM
jgi:ADP-ribosylglycohydrolase